jgi:hypothetical protein
MSFSFDQITWTSWETFDTAKSLVIPTNDGVKTIYFRTRDLVGNIAEPVSGTIILDTEPPENMFIHINNGATYTNQYTVTLTLGAIDTLSGLGDMAFSTDGITWSDWTEFKNTETYTMSSEIPDGTVNIYFKARDIAGNIAEPVFSIIILDTTPPESITLTINGGAKLTASETVTLDIFAIDPLSGTDEMSFSDDGTTWGAWEAYSNTKSYILSQDLGTKTIYLRVSDVAGNIAEPVSSSIELSDTGAGQDSDGDGIPDDSDAFPNDPAASIDLDMDGLPDKWNPGKSELDSTTNLFLDQFPNDGDNDGVIDSKDAFPTDAAASVDTDGDDYPDSWNPGKNKKDSTTGLSIDEYPNNQKRHTKDQKDSSQFIETLIIIVVVVTIIIVIILAAAGALVSKNRRIRKEANKPYSDDKHLWELHQEVIHGEVISTPRLSDEQIDDKLDERFQKGEISPMTYQMIKNEK